MRRAWCLLAALMLLAACAVVPARAQQPQISLQIVGVTDAGYPNARAIVTVEEAGTSAAPNLTAQDVSVTLAGQTARVLSTDLATTTSNPLDVVIVIDTSGSMAGEPITLAKEAAKAFIQQLSPGDRVAIVRFSNDVQLAQDFTVDHAAAASVIDGLTAAGNTALYEATAAAALKAGTSSAARRAIVLLSDGADYGTSGTTTRDQALTAVHNVGAPFFAIGEGTDIDRAYLQQVADRSNGRYLEAPDPNQLGALYGGIARLLQSQYEITFDASAVSGGADVPLEIAVRVGDKTASASTTYHPAAVPAPQVTVEGIAAGESLTAARTVTVNVAGPAPVSRVTFALDGNTVAERTAPPYTWTYDPRSFSGGAHELSVSAQGAGGAVETKVAFTSAPPAVSGADSTLLYAAVGAGGAVGAALAIGLILVRRRRRKPATAVAQIAAIRARTQAQAVAPPEEPPVEAAREVIEEPKGLLISRAGSDVGAEYIVGSRPVSIGSGELCAVRVPDRGLSSVEARIWVRGGRLMVHRMMSLNALANEGTTGGWIILDPGETFELGPHQFEFRLLPETSPAAGPSDVPDVLRDAEWASGPGQAAGASPASAEASRLRLVDLMPKNDVSEPDDPEERVG